MDLNGTQESDLGWEMSELDLVQRLTMRLLEHDSNNVGERW